MTALCTRSIPELYKIMSHSIAVARICICDIYINCNWYNYWKVVKRINACTPSVHPNAECLTKLWWTHGQGICHACYWVSALTKENQQLSHLPCSDNKNYNSWFWFNVALYFPWWVPKMVWWGSMNCKQIGVIPRTWSVPDKQRHKFVQTDRDYGFEMIEQQMDVIKV